MKRTLFFVGILAVAVALSPLLIWNFIRYLLDGFRAMK